MARNHVDHHRLEMIASNIAAYISTQWTDIRHPTHKTSEERKLATKKRRKAKKSVNISAIKTALDK
jgi:flagellar basal body rod protein FlgC